MKFPESQLAHDLLDGLKGVEIGASAHNPFNIQGCIFVDYTKDMNTTFKKEEMDICGEAIEPEIEAVAWDLPFKDESLDYVLSSHVIEHCWDVIGTIEEWFRVLKPGGYIFMIIPHKERTFDKDRIRTNTSELLWRHGKKFPGEDKFLFEHHSVWITEDWEDLVNEMKWNLVCLADVDDKVGNGFTIVLQK